MNDNGKRPLSATENAGASTAIATATATTTTTTTTTTTLPPLHRTDRNGEPLSEKKLRRLEKNRLSARECRRRKREATENMQHQINLLESENLRLRIQLQVGEEAEESNQQEQQKLTEGLDRLLKSGASESEIYHKIEEYKEKFADYGRDRRSAIEFHLRNIERLLMPTQTTSVVLTSLNMDFGATTNTTGGAVGADAPATTTTSTTTTTTTATETTTETTTETPAPATTTSTTPTTTPSNDAATATKPDKMPSKALFRHLVQHLEVTPEQAIALKDSRMVAQEMDDCLQSSLGVLKEMRRRLTQCGQDLEQEFDHVRHILTPTQAAKFLVWVANNKACMHMLNELWNRVYPQDGGPALVESLTGSPTPIEKTASWASSVSRENSPQSE
eukprot:Nitzschia sp. Nitz4//scaffold26_size159584//31197//32557//NITZ4_002475-RA/size159584-processed-gene-0.183-mRNA-1//1//CDS//3329545034//3978//frame0